MTRSPLRKLFPGARGEMRYQSGCVRGKRDLRTSPPTRSILVSLDSIDSLYLASETEVLILTPGSASWSTLRVDASRRRRGFLREMIGPTPRMLGVGWTIAGAVARCKPIPDPIVAVVSSRKRAVHSPGATAAQRELES